jgi:hypothetical protein
MRKLLMLVTLSLAYFGVIGAMSAGVPPGCNPCPWVR